VTIHPAEAFDAYMRVRDRLPPFTRGGRCTSSTLMDAAGAFDLVLFDAYGVLNVGETAIPGAAATVAALRSMGKMVGVVSNSAAYPKARMMARYATLGLDFLPHEVVTSRETLVRHVEAAPQRHWGVMLGSKSDMDEIGQFDTTILEDAPAPYADVEGFLLIGSDGWTEDRQSRLEGALRDRPRPDLVGNPDLVARREYGLSLEPGWFGHRIADATDVQPRYFGKPFPDVFHLALSRYPLSIRPERVLMVGDTLHTDILGGSQAGFATALVTAHGSPVGLDVMNAISRSGISPDFLMPSI